MSGASNGKQTAYFEVEKNKGLNSYPLTFWIDCFCECVQSYKTNKNV